MKPSIGRIVHYITPEMYAVEGRMHLAAMVIAIEEDGTPRLMVWDRMGNDRLVQRVPEDQAAKTGHSWHWPEREE